MNLPKVSGFRSVLLEMRTAARFAPSAICQTQIVLQTKFGYAARHRSDEDTKTEQRVSCNATLIDTHLAYHMPYFLEARFRFPPTDVHAVFQVACGVGGPFRLQSIMPHIDTQTNAQIG